MNLSRCVKDSIIALNAYDDVDIESTIYPTKCSMTIYNNELRLNLVVEKDGEYLPIKLKYKTKAISRNIKRFWAGFS